MIWSWFYGICHITSKWNVQLAFGGYFLSSAGGAVKKCIWKGQYFSSLEKELDLLENQQFSSSTGFSITEKSRGLCVLPAPRLRLPKGTDTLTRSHVFYNSKDKCCTFPPCRLWNNWQCLFVPPCKSLQDHTGMTIYCEGQCSINSTLVESWDMDTDCLGSFLSSVANDLCNLGKFLKPSVPLFPNGIHLIGMTELNLVMCIKYLEV